MAEVLGLVTAIGAIITSGFQVATAISTIVDDLGTAGAQVQAIAVETRTILLTLRSINKHLIRARRVTTEVANIVGDIIALCRKDIDDIKECVAPLLVKRAEEMPLKNRLRWLFAKSKVSTRQASLNSLKLTLALFLQALDLMEEDYIEDYMQVVVQQKISESRNVKKSFIEAERRDRAFEKAYEPSQAISSPKMIGQSGLETEELSHTIICTTTEGIKEMDGDKSVSKAMVKILHYQSGDGSSDEETSDLLPRHQSGLDHTTSTIDFIDDISDGHFIAIADHMRLQKTVSSFALVVINQRQEMRPDDATLFSTAEDTSSVMQSEEVNSATGSGASQRRGSRAGATSEATEHTDAERASTMSPSDGPPGARATFDSSSDAQQTPGTPYGATERHPPMSASNNWETRYPENSIPEGTPPHSGPRHDGLNSMQFGSYPHFQRSTSSPYEFQPPMYDPEKMTMHEELERLRATLAKRDEEERMREEKDKLRKLEERIRKEAEAAIAIRMEEMRNAQGEAKVEVENARREAEQAAREAIEAERKAEEQKQKLHQEAMNRAERDARQKIENELRAEHDAKTAREKYEEGIRAVAEAKRQSGFLRLFSRKQVGQGKR